MVPLRNNEFTKNSVIQSKQDKLCSSFAEMDLFNEAGFLSDLLSHILMHNTDFVFHKY